MSYIYREYTITDEKSKMQFDVICSLLKDAYWSKNWSQETIEEAMSNSVCFGVFHKGKQIAYARCVTDNATIYWLCDVIVQEKYRNQGIGSALIQYIVTHEKFNKLIGILSTNHSKEFYKKYGFRLSTNGFMIKSVKK